MGLCYALNQTLQALALHGHEPTVPWGDYFALTNTFQPRLSVSWSHWGMHFDVRQKGIYRIKMLTRDTASWGRNGVGHLMCLAGSRSAATLWLPLSPPRCCRCACGEACRTDGFFHSPLKTGAYLLVVDISQNPSNYFKEENAQQQYEILQKQKEGR